LGRDEGGPCYSWASTRSAPSPAPGDMDFGPAQIEISLRSRSRALLLLLAVCSASLFLAAETLLVGITSSFDKPPVGRWLLAFNSDDPELHYWLGRSYEGTKPAEGVQCLRRATELSPYSRHYWSRLAKACESLGDSQCADQAWERLLLICPMVPLYHWHVAQRGLRTKRLDEAMAEFRRLLELDPSYAPSTWASLRAVESPDAIFQKTLADRSDSMLKVGYIEFLSAGDEDAAAYQIWKRVVENPSRFPFSSAQPYLNRLIDRGRIEEAVGVWGDLERLGVVRRPQGDESGNLVFNGDFEQFPLNAGFDWRWSDQLTYLAIDFSAPAAYRGARCLRVDFTVSRNQEYEPVYQIVPVLSNHTYRLEAYVRSEDITSDTGPALRVSDTQQPSFRDVFSDTTVGTTPWHPIRVYFSAGPETHAVRLSVWRPLGRVFPTEITGSFWMDAVSLECLDP